MALDAEGVPDYPDKPTPDASSEAAPSTGDSLPLDPVVARVADLAFRAEHCVISPDGGDDEEVTAAHERIEANPPTAAAAARTALADAIQDHAAPESADHVEPAAPDDQGKAEPDEADTDARSVGAESADVESAPLTPAELDAIREEVAVLRKEIASEEDALCSIQIQHAEELAQLGITGRAAEKKPGLVLGATTRVCVSAGIVSYGNRDIAQQTNICFDTVSIDERGYECCTTVEVPVVTSHDGITMPEDGFTAADVEAVVRMRRGLEDGRDLGVLAHLGTHLRWIDDPFGGIAERP